MTNGFLDDLPDLWHDEYPRRKGRRKRIPVEPYFPEPRFVDYPAISQRLVRALMNNGTRQKWQAGSTRVLSEVRSYDQQWANDPNNPFPLKWLKNNLPRVIKRSQFGQFNKLSQEDYSLWRRIVKEQTGFNIAQGTDKTLEIFNEKQAEYLKGHRIFYIWEAEGLSRLIADGDLICCLLGIYHDHVCEFAPKVVADKIRNVDLDAYEHLRNFAGRLTQVKLYTLLTYAEGKGLLEPVSKLPKDAGGKDDISWQAKAIALLWEHRDWSIEKVSQEVDRSRKTLYSDPDISAAIKARNKQKKAQNILPGGDKNAKSGKLEAW